MHVFIAIILVLSSNHELLGGSVLAGTSDSIEACETKAKIFIRENIDQVPPSASVALACDELPTLK